MIIDKIDIYGYGKWVNQQFELSEGLQLFVGENEAGKSTLQSFIRSILFGFPTRHRRVNQLNTYEPKTSEKYGGRLLLKETTVGDVWVERTQSGVTITTPDGQILPESQLDQILAGLDVNLYDSFYSFTLANLQELANIGSDQLNDYFLGIGTLGSDKFIELSNHLEKQSTQLYKKGGSVPPLNVLLNEYEELQQRTAQYESQSDTYQQFIAQKQHVELQIEQNIAAIKEAEIDLHQSEQLLAMYQIYQRLVKVRKELGELTYTPISNTLNTELTNTEAMIERLQNENVSLASRLEELQSQLKQETRLEWANNRTTEREQWLQLTIQAKEDYNNLEKLERQLVEIEHRLNQLAQRGQFYPDKINQQKTIPYEEAESLLSQTAEIERQIDRIGIERKHFIDQRKDVQNQIAQRQQQITYFEHQAINLKEQLKEVTRPSDYLVGLLMLLIGGVIWLYNQFQPLNQLLIRSGFGLLLAGILMIGYIAFSHARKRQEYDLDAIDQSILALEHEIEHFAQQMQQLSLTINAREDEQNHSKQQLTEFNQQKRHWLTQHGFYPTADLELIVKTNPVQQYIDEKEKQSQFQKEAGGLKARLANWLEKITPMLERFPASSAQLRDLIRHVETIESNLQLVLNNSRINLERQTATQESIDINMQEIERLNQFIQDEYQKLNVENRKEFDQLIERNEYIRSLEEKERLYLEQIGDKEAQLEQIGDQASLEAIIERHQRKLQSLRDSIEPLQHQRANCAVEINNLEQDGTYSDLLQQLEDQRAAIIELYQDWATRKLSSSMIVQTLRQGLDNPIEEMNDLANQIFKILSNHRYEHIRINKRNLKVVMATGDVFEPHELSQGTLEQLYVSLRLAFIQSAVTMIRMPIIIDDAFVNFDETRRSYAYDVLKQVGEKHQILYFTFDKAVCDQFESEQIIDLEKMN